MNTEKINKRKNLLKVGKALKALKALTVLYLSFLTPISTLAFSNKDSTNIGVFTNCNNFIVAKKYVTTNACPDGQGNSYVGEKGTMTYFARFVGLKKEIPVGIYENSQIGKNAELFKIQTNCGFRGEQYSHLAESTDKIHQMLPPRSNEVKYNGCYDQCDKIKQVKEALKDTEGQRYVPCENNVSKSFLQKWRKTIIYPKNVSFVSENGEDKYYISEADCNSVSIKEEIYFDNSAEMCKRVGNQENDIIVKTTKKDGEFEIQVGTIGNDYWPTNEYVRNINLNNVLKQIDLSIKDVIEMHIDRVEMDDWLEVFTEKGSFMSFPYPQYKNLTYCTPRLERYGQVYYNNSCDAKDKTPYQVEMGTSWRLTTQYGGNCRWCNGKAPPIAIENIMPKLNINSSKNIITFKTFVGGDGEFYIKFKGKYKENKEEKITIIK